MVRETGSVVDWERSQKERHLLSLPKEERIYGLWWCSPAFLFAAADLVYVLQEDGGVALQTEGQRYSTWTWISFEQYSENNRNAFEEACVMETKRRDQETNKWLHKGKN